MYFASELCVSLTSLIWINCEGDFHAESQDADIINVELYYFFLNFLDIHRTNQTVYSQHQHACRLRNTDEH